MKLITEAIWKRMPKLGATEEKRERETVVQAKLFTPDSGATWYITEGDRESGRLFGLCDLGLGFPEVGYVTLHELEGVRGRLGLPVERDLHWEGSLADAWDEVRHSR